MDSNITFSPDGHKVAFMRYDNPEQGKYRLIVRSLDTGQETTLTGGPNSQSLVNPAWSPDGKTILCVVNQPGNALTGLMAVDVATGQQHLVISSASIFFSPTWLPEGRGVLVLVKTADSNYTREQIYFVAYPTGHMDPITRDTNNYSDLSVSASGQVLATVLSEERWNLEVISATKSGADARPVAPVSMFTNFTWTHDGRLLYDKDNLLNWLNLETGAKGIFSTGQNPGNGDPWECCGWTATLFFSTDFRVAETRASMCGARTRPAEI